MSHSSSSHAAYTISETRHTASLSRKPTQDFEEDPSEHKVSSGRSTSIHSPTPTPTPVSSPPICQGPPFRQTAQMRVISPTRVNFESRPHETPTWEEHLMDHPGYPTGPRPDINRYPHMVTGVPVSQEPGMTLEELSSMQYLCAEITRAIYTTEGVIVIRRRAWYLGLSAMILVLALVLMVALMFVV
ncbi:hypothetical protein Tco_0174102 [Tanacetum coccineum]